MSMIEQHSTLSEKFLRKWVWLYIFSFIVAPIGYIIKMIISHNLDVSEVWIIYWIISIIVLLTAYNEFWITESILYFTPKFITEKRYDKIKTLLFYGFWVQMFTSILLTLFFFFWADIIGKYYIQDERAIDVLKVFSLFFIGINIFELTTNFFQAVQDTFYAKLSEFIRMLTILMTVLYVFFFDERTILAFSKAWIIGLYSWILFSVYIFYVKYYKVYLSQEKIFFDLQFFKEIAKYGILVVLSVQVGSLLSQIDMQMILLLLGTQAAWYYTNYLSIVSIAFLIIWPIFMLLFPVFTELAAKKENAKIRDIKSELSTVFISIIIPYSFFFFIFSKLIATFFFGIRFIESWNILQYSIFFLIFNFFLQINFHILWAIWKMKERVKILMYAIILNIITNYIFLNMFWVYGWAISSGIGWIFIYFMSEKILTREYAVNFNWFKIAKSIIIFSILSIITLYFIPSNVLYHSKIFQFSILLLFWGLWGCVLFLMEKSYIAKVILEIKKLKHWK